uniref:Chemosensory protein n=1 Tax=Galeruca daurica TaxID=1651263 RepID=A0A1W6GWH2_9CUCU|nr:chemosensory protein [Galeruca daurica]
MNFVFVLCAFSLIAVVSAEENNEKYTTKYDNVDVDKILQSDRLLRNYIDCLLGKTQCTKDGQELKNVLTDALKTKCEKCSEIQKKQAIKVITYLLKNKRSWWNEVEAVYDPTHNYRQLYQKEIKEAGLEL